MNSPSEAASLRYANLVVQTLQTLQAAQDLSPLNPSINQTLSGFVSETMRPRPAAEVKKILDNPVVQKAVPDLRRLLSRAEYEMECYSAEVFTGLRRRPAGDRYGTYNGFIYRDNYEALVDIEMKALGWPKKRPAVRKEQQSVAFVGAGPWPMSAVMLHERTGYPVTCIDSDARACELGRRVIAELARREPERFGDLSKKITYAHAPGDRHDYATHPVVLIASLVTRKDPVIMQIIASSDTGRTVVVRTAEKLSTLLYPPHENVGGLEDYNFYLTRKTPECPQAINSSLVYRIPPGKFRMRHKVDANTTMGWNDMPVRPLGRHRWRTQSKDYVV